MKKLEITAFELAQRFMHTKEIQGKVANPQIMAMLNLDAKWPEDDSVPWCSGFVNYICWMLRLPRSKSLLARSWLGIGAAVTATPEVGFDVVILKRGTGKQPGPEILDAPGHVGFFGGYVGGKVQVLGGNQNDEVSLSPYSIDRILSIRRLYG